MTTNGVLELTEYLGASALIAAGVKLIEVRPPTGFRSRCVLVFNDGGGEASRVLAEHQAGRLTVNSRDFAEAVNSVKAKIFAVRG